MQVALRDRLLTMAPRALRAFAARWFLLGFSLSGRGFHGETLPPRSHAAVRKILLVEFDRVWNADRAARVRKA